MAEFFVFRPKSELDASDNLQGFIISCRDELTIFGKDLRFDENTWDVTATTTLKGRGNERRVLVFSNLSTVADKDPKWMAEPFLSFAKAYVRYMQGLRPTKNLAFRLSALRSLETALSENGLEPDPVKIDLHTFNRAGQLLADRYAESTAYRIASQLEMVAEFLTDNRLTVVPTKWRNHLTRPKDSIRVGKEFDQRRLEKMPSEAALDALPKVYNLAIAPSDIIISSVAAILCSAPDRINEVLLLQENCEVTQKTGEGDKEAFGLRWFPAKGADPMIKWIVPSMVTVVKEAVEKLRQATDESRRIAKWYEQNPKQLYLPDGLKHLRKKEWLSTKEIADILGMGNADAGALWAKTHSLEPKWEGRRQYYRFADVQTIVINMLPEGFPILDKDTGLKYSEALILCRVNELHATRGTYPCMIEPISLNQINTGLGGRVQHGIPSIFTRHGFTEPDGSPIKITTHQFRHYLNTLAQAGGMSQLDIAKWSGRKDIRQNAAYDHVTSDQMIRKIRDALGDSSQMFGPLAEIPKKVLIPRDEFARLKVPTAHTTDLGYCIHDYTMSPCQLHMDCINCEDLVCVKGDVEKTEKLRQRLDEARMLMSQAEQAVHDEYVGSNRWLEHHRSTVERLDQLCSIMQDPSVPIGSLIQLSHLQMDPAISSTARSLNSSGKPKALPHSGEVEERVPNG